MPTFSDLKAGYARLWATMEIKSTKLGVVNGIVLKLLASKARYQAVEKATGVPWFVIAALHNRESDADFDTYLGNGEPLNRKTTLVPRGRGPFRSWEAGAMDALALDGLDKVGEWSIERACYEIEKFNGFGYRGKGVNSPYLWSYTNNYSAGKYVGDGQFSYDAVDKQCGALPIIKQIMEKDKTARFKSKAPTDVAVGTGAGTATTAAVTHAFGIDLQTAILIGVGVAVAIAVILTIIRKRS